MKLMEIAQLLGNFGEFFGSIAVVVTLAFLVVQVRQNTKMMRSNIHASWVELSSKTHEMRMNHAELISEVYKRGRTLNDLNPTESVAHDALFMHLLNTWEASYLNYLEGASNESLFEAKHRNLVGVFTNVPHFLESWNGHQPGPWDSRFVDYVTTRVLPDAEKGSVTSF